MLSNKNFKIDSFRLAASCALVIAVMATALYTHANKVQDIIKKLQDKGSLANVEWLVEHVSYFIPVVVVAIAMTVFYSIFKKGAPVAICREKTIASAVVLVVTYGIMLPIVLSKTKIVDEEEIKLIDICINWFAFQFVPLVILALYHNSRAEYEKKLIEVAEAGEKSADTEKEQK